MPTVAELLRGASDIPGESARRDAEILLCYCLSKPRTWLYTWPESEVKAQQASQFSRLLASRVRGHPVAHLVGHREFWSLNLRITEHTLIPRPETEMLVEWALDLLLPDDAAVLDLGTGSGAIALALASEKPQWDISAVDASLQALEVARQNGRELELEGVQFIHSDWFSAVAGRHFHLLVGNPPYIEESDTHLSMGDLRYEPLSALVADKAGMSDLIKLIEGATVHLCSDGWLLLEHGHTQGIQVRAQLHQSGFVDIETRRDLAGHERVTGGRWHVQ